jgi:hypothetical protein
MRSMPQWAAVLTSLLTLGWALPATALPWPGSGPSKKRGLYAAIKSFKTFDGCMAQLVKRVPVEMSALLKADALEVVCRSHQAVAEDDPKACQSGIKDYRARKDCQRFYAIYTGRPNNCPTRGYPRYPEGECLAMASRNAGLCRLVDPRKRSTCQGALHGLPFCKALKGAEQSTCQVAAHTWKGVVKAGKVLPAKSFKPFFKVQTTALSGGITLSPKMASFSSGRLDQGILLGDKGGKNDWLVINYSFAPTEYYINHKRRGPIKVELQVPLGSQPIKTYTLTGGPGGSAKVNFSSRRPTYRYVRMNSSSGGKVTVTKLERKLGGRVEGSFDLNFSDGVDKLRVQGSFATFVRHLVPSTQLASYMRHRVRPRKRYHYNRGRLSPAELAKAKDRVRKVNDTLFDVDPSLRDEVVTDTAKIRYGASISSARSQGGYKLYTVYRNSVLWQVGFRDRDVVTKVNKYHLDKPEDAYAAYGKLRKARKLVFTIERGSSTVKLTLRIKRVRAKKKKKTKKTRGAKKKAKRKSKAKK